MFKLGESVMHCTIIEHCEQTTLLENQNTIPTTLTVNIIRYRIKEIWVLA